MNRWIRRGLVAAAAAATLAAGTAAAGLALSHWRLQRTVPLPPQVDAAAPALRSDAAALERGRYLYASRGCVDCHGAAGAGRTFVHEGDALHLAGPDITSAGATARYTAADWARTLRHGVKPDGTALRVMPSQDYARWSDPDLAAVVAYVRSLPPGGGAQAVVQLPLPARVLHGFGAMPSAADLIDHALPPAEPVAEGVTVEHGRAVAGMCVGCHGATLAGGRIPGSPPHWPAAAALAGAGSAMARYADAEALAALFRTGRSPEGRPVAVMPFESLRALSDTDVRALHLYLRSLGGGATTAAGTAAPHRS